MRIVDSTIRLAGRFAVGLGTGLALVCAFVIVETDPGGRATAVDVVRLDPVVVTISADRYAEWRATARTPSAAVRTDEHGAEAG